MRRKQLVSLAMVVIATGASSYATTGAHATNAADATVALRSAPSKTFVCAIEGDVIVTAPSPTAAPGLEKTVPPPAAPGAPQPVASAMGALVAPAKGTATLTGSGPANLTGAQVLLSITDNDPSATPGAPVVETGIYSASPIGFTAPAAPTGLPILSAPLALDTTDSGPDCPNPTSGSSFNLALTLFGEQGDDAHFTLTTENDPGANLELNCAEQDVDTLLSPVFRR
jgi:hypothetical protein